MGPARFHCATLLPWPTEVKVPLHVHCTQLSNHDEINVGKRDVSEVGFEPTPTEVDYDLNVAP